MQNWKGMDTGGRRSRSHYDNAMEWVTGGMEQVEWKLNDKWRSLIDEDQRLKKVCRIR